MEVASQRDAHALVVASRLDLRERIRKQTAFRINTCRSYSMGSSLTARDVGFDLPGTTQLGYYRALLTRFAGEKELTHEWWIQQRKAHGVGARDSRSDHAIVLVHFPEFASYYPATEITDDEIVDGAVEELSRWVASPGTDYHTTKLLRKMQRDLVSPQGELTDTLQRYWTAGSTWKESDADNGASSGQTVNLIDPRAQKRIEDLAEGNDVEDAEQIFGTYAARVAMLAMRHYGPIYGLYWFCERFFLKRKYSDVLRILGGSENVLGVTEFERVKKHMTRNLPIMHEQMLRIIAADPVLADVIGQQHTPRPTEIPSDPARKLAAEEREKSKARNYRKLCEKLSTPHRSWLDAQTQAVKDHWITRFRGVVAKGMGWSALVADMQEASR